MEQALTLDAVSFFKEVRDLYKETDRQFREMSKELREMSQETDKRFKETDILIGRLGNRLGDFVEGMVKPSAVKIFKERGIKVHQVSRDINAERDGGRIQIDLLVVNSSVRLGSCI